MSVAIATAPRMTSAYSAVVCPAEPERSRARSHTTRRRNMEASSGWDRIRGARSEAQQAGRQAGHHGEQYERGEHEEDEGEEQANGHLAGVGLRASAERGTLLAREPCQRVADRRAETIRRQQRVAQRFESRHGARDVVERGVEASAER